LGKAHMTSFELIPPLARSTRFAFFAGHAAETLRYAGPIQPILCPIPNRFAVKVIGLPFKTFQEAEKACQAVLGHLKDLSGVTERSYSPSLAHRRSV